MTETTAAIKEATQLLQSMRMAALKGNLTVLSRSNMGRTQGAAVG